MVHGVVRRGVADFGHVVVGLVVGENRLAPALLRGQVARGAAGVAQKTRGAEGGVVDLLRVRVAVAVGVATVARPRLGDELHRADGAVELGVVVEGAAVGVGDVGEAVAVELRADDRRLRVAVLV